MVTNSAGRTPPISIPPPSPAAGAAPSPRLRASLACLACVASAGLVATAVAAPPPLGYKVTRSFSTIYDKTGTMPLKWKINGTDGIAWDGTGLWITACDTPVFAKLDPTGKLLDEFSLPDKEIADHLAWDGSYLWADVHHKNGTLIQIDTAAREVLKTIALPFEDVDKMVPMGLAFDGRWLWTADPGGKALYRIDPETGAGADEPFMPIPKYAGQTIRPCGVISDGHSCLWLGDLGFGVFFQVDAKTGEVVSYLNPPENPDPTKFGKFRPPEVKKLFTGMTMGTDGRVWVVDELEGNPLVYELQVDFPKTGKCAQPVGVGQPCSAGGEPFCGTGAVCWGPAGSETTCRRRCDRSKQDCADGSACWTVAGVGDVCRPEATAGYEGDPCSGDADCATALCLAGPGPGSGSCVEACPGGGTACYEGADAGAPAGVDAEETDGGAPVVAGGRPEPAREGGCAAGPRPAGTLGVLALLLVGLGALAWRRRRGHGA